MATEELFCVPPNLSRLDTDADGWRVEQLRYRATARAKSKFKSVLSAQRLFGTNGSCSTVTTQQNDAKFELTISHEVAGTVQTEILRAQVQRGRIRPLELRRTVGLPTDPGGYARDERARFSPEPFGLPEACYPEVMLPFLMRGQPLDGRSRAVWSWTNDRFVARVYYEVRKTVDMTVPAGRFSTALIWMYPDLNDWIAMGGVVTRLAKPLLPRYDIWIERGPERRVIRFEGPYGPPGAPEVVLELMPAAT